MKPRPASRLAPAAALLACLALVLAGCTKYTGEVTHFTPAPATVHKKADCLATSYWNEPLMTAPPDVADTMGSVPQNFVPVDVVVCSPGPQIFRQVSTEPAWASILEEHHSGDYTALLTALEQQSDRQSDGSCFSMAEIIPDLWLVDAAGSAVHIEWPHDACGFSKPGTREALAALPVSSSTSIDTRPPDAVEQITPAPARVLPGVDCMTTAHWYEGNGVEDPSAKDMGSIPEDFIPVSMVECTAFGDNVTDAQGTWRTIVQRQYSGDMVSVVKTLRSPSERALGKLVCEASLEVLPDLWLVDAAGKAVHVDWPLTACGKPVPGTKENLAQLHLDETRVLKAVLLQDRQAPDVPTPAATDAVQ